MKGDRTWRVARWHIARALNCSKSRHVVAIGLLSFSATTVGFIDYPLYVETRNLSAQLASIRAEQKENQKKMVQDEKPRDLVDEFVAALPVYATYPKHLRKLQDLADNKDISIRKIDFRYEHLAGLQISKLMLHADLIGDETRQRQLMQVILNTFPNLSIAKLSLVNDIDQGSNVEQKLDMNLYYRSDKVSR